MSELPHQLFPSRTASPTAGRSARPLIAWWLAFPALAAPGAALAQNAPATISTPDLGNIAAAASGTTVFNFSTSGAVSRTSGVGTRISSGTAVFQVTVSCKGAPCNSNNSKVTVSPSATTPTGRAQALSNFSGQMGTATLVGSITGTNPMTFTIKPIGNGKTATFTVGADFPISGDDASGPPATGIANTAITVVITNTSGGQATTSSGTAKATVFRSPSISKSSDLVFGRFVRPASGSGTIALAASTGSLSVGAGIALSTPVPSRATFMVTGEGNQTISVGVPTTFDMTSGTNTLTVATSNDAQGLQQLSGSLGAAGTFPFHVGGSFTLSSTTPSGAYQGTFTVTANYN